MRAESKYTGLRLMLVILIASGFIFLNLFDIPLNGANNENASIAVKNYLELERLHAGWSEDFFGKGPYYRRVLYNYLVDKLGQEILTDYNYVLISPEGIYRRRLRCKLSYGRWLHIIGDVEIESIKEIIRDDITVLKRWWRSRRLLAVQGRIRRFRIESDEWGKRVVLYLDKIRVKGL
jgi:hypothetical protein